jgi:hypothetical protein
MHNPSIMQTLQSFAKFSSNNDNVSLRKLIMGGTHLMVAVSKIPADLPQRTPNKGHPAHQPSDLPILLQQEHLTISTSHLG